MKKFYIFIILINLLIAPGLATGEHDKGNEIPWDFIDYSFLRNSGEYAEIYTLLDSAVCNNDNLKSLICFDYGWKDACLEIFAMYALSENIPYIYKENSLPVLQMGGNEKIDLNPVLKIEPKLGYLIIPKALTEDYALWRVAVGSLETHLTVKEGLVYQLLNEDRLNIYFELQNGTVMRSHANLHGLKPLLEAIIEKARAAKPTDQVCK